jgi:hypothetical protein
LKPPLITFLYPFYPLKHELLTFVIPLIQTIYA